jgi:hypothetical protein
MVGLSSVGTRIRALTGSGEILATCKRLLAIALVSGLIVWLLDPVLNTTFDGGLFWRNALPIALFFALLFGLFGRVLVALLLGGAICWSLFVVNTIKESNLAKPLLPGDLVLWKQAIDNLAFFSNYTGGRLALLLAILVLAALIALALYIERRWQHPGWKSRTVWSALSLAALFTLFHGDGAWSTAYGDEALPGFEGWNPTESVQQIGLMANLVRMTQLMKMNIPPPDPLPISRFVNLHADELKQRAARTVPAELPDIVVVQSEAFFDPGVLKTVDPGRYAPNFERLADTGITGSLTTPTYGGGTIRTEFETLTGYPMLAFPDIEYPYFGLAAAWMPTVPRRLQAMGYSTTLFHPFRADFWNREKVMPVLGFQNTHYEAEYRELEHAGLFVSDHALFDFVLAHLATQTGGPSFSMVITMENHGPWARTDPLTDVLKGTPLPNGLSKQGRLEMTYYLSHLLNGDTALADFSQRLLARPRWTLLLFYGDHLPALTNAFNDLGFDDNDLASNEHTRYMLLSNRPLNAGLSPKLDLYAYELPGLLFDAAGLPEDGFLGMSAAIRHARLLDPLKRESHYGALQAGFAELEVSCKGKLGPTAQCPLQSAPAAASHAP